ncbi:MAG: T9SS type A sorting domain-containing protein [Bacteroidia bacterium]|nr:T9SS type A sorting domain-containing protein [Bacteroidia bacterium]
MKKNYLILIIILTSFLTANAQYTKLFDFEGSASGCNPEGTLISDGTYLYGMTSTGGTNNFGTIYKIKFDGTGYYKLLDFNGAVNGKEPFGSLILDGVFLYGMTHGGGVNDMGTIFRIKTNGTSYFKLLDFSGTSNGKGPLGSLILNGLYLYGMTQEGGTNNMGKIFKIKPDGTGYSTLLNFAGITNGNGPAGTLIFDGTFFYGTTIYGGTNNNGTIFKIKPDGTGYLKLLDLDGVNNGMGLVCSLISDGTFLYGMTVYGGLNNLGTIFKIKPDGTGYLKLRDFDDNVNGYKPFGSLTFVGTVLYGMTSYSGTNSHGIIFKVKPDGSDYLKLLDFAGISNGSFPYASSLFYNGTSLYGVTEGGGTNQMGTIFKYDIVIGIDDNQLESEINTFPNPNNGLFIVKKEVENTIDKIEIYNILGEKIYFSNIMQNNAVEINITNSPNGIYFVKIYEKERFHIEKILKH